MQSLISSALLEPERDNVKIACDVKGTLEGDKKKQVLKILDLFHRAGYEIIIWSNMSSYAHDAVRDNNLRAEPMGKKMMLDYDDPSEAMNYCIEDDRSQTWLGAHKFIWVDEIPEDITQIELFVRELLDGQ